jgi:hypothetical protein
MFKLVISELEVNTTPRTNVCKLIFSVFRSGEIIIVPIKIKERFEKNSESLSICFLVSLK